MLMLVDAATIFATLAMPHVAMLICRRFAMMLITLRYIMLSFAAATPPYYYFRHAASSPLPPLLLPLLRQLRLRYHFTMLYALRLLPRRYAITLRAADAMPYDATAAAATPLATIRAATLRAPMLRCRCCRIII